MELLHDFLSILLHLDKHLQLVVEQYGAFTYAILFAIIFCETGLVITPFLPGDSLLFTTGAMAGAGILHPWLLMATLFVAAVSGDTLNYTLGRHLGPQVFRRESRFIHKGHLVRTQLFYERHGGKTLSMARFVPIVRTFAPFVAGVAMMPLPRFLFFSVAGGLLWIVSLVGLGYFFGNLPIVKENFTLAIYGVILVSILPILVEIIRSRLRRPEA